MTYRRSRTFALLASAVAILFASTAPDLGAQAAQVPTPEDYFGFRMGTDGRLARWDRMVEYYRMLGEESDRIQVWEMGETTLGNPFLALMVSAPENLARLDELQELNALLSDPRGATDAAIENAIATGKAVIVQGFCLHSTEVAGGQTAVEVAYDLAVRDDPEMDRILDETIGIMIPCLNPDGQIMVTDWVDETRGTPYQGAGLPSLYHHYIGHDNNRDAFMQNTIESFYGGEILFREWVPQAFVDHHQMGGYTARIYLPPYAEPIRPEGDPIVWREMSWYGAHMAYKMEEEDLEGSINAAIYSGWGHFGFHWITPFHNIAGMLTESASANLAWPLYVHPEQLTGSRQLPEYEGQTTMPNPWEGGWWTVRDIVDRQKVSFMATLDIAARNREMVLRNAYLKAQRQTERGMEGDVRAFLIPATQHDGLTTVHMVNKLLLQGIEVRQADAGFTHEGRVYGEGTWIVDMAQPKRGVIRWLLGETRYPDNSYTRTPEGDPIRPYDMTGDVMAEFMGVDVVPVGSLPSTASRIVTGQLTPRGQVAMGSANGYRLDGRQNATFRAVNQLWDQGVPVRRVDESTGSLHAGDFLVPAAEDRIIQSVAEDTGVSFEAMEMPAESVGRPVERLRVGMFQRYMGGNMDEGWTRWVLEDFDFPYTSLFDADLTAQNLTSNYDVVILPDDALGAMTGDAYDDQSNVPPDYRSGFGDAGVEALEAFVGAGGTLVTFARAGDLPIERFDLPVRDVTDDVPTREFYAPGATLRIEVDNDHPLAYGMPEHALATFLANNQVYEVSSRRDAERVRRIASFGESDILGSGWLIGEDVIASRAAVVTVEHGQGQVVLIGFRAQHRAQAHGTFKLIFNALVSGPDSDG